MNEFKYQIQLCTCMEHSQLQQHALHWTLQESCSITYPINYPKIISPISVVSFIPHLIRCLVHLLKCYSVVNIILTWDGLFFFNEICVQRTRHGHECGYSTFQISRNLKKLKKISVYDTYIHIKKFRTLTVLKKLLCNKIVVKCK